MKYRFICIPLVILLFIACIPSAYATSYSDVDRARLGVEAFEAIMYVTDNGIMSGVGNSMFSPSSSVTRAQIVQILYNMAGNPSVSGSNPFNDVSLTAWYRPAVQWAYSNGIANGTSANTFSPDAVITVEQAISFLYRYESSYCNLPFSISPLVYTHNDYSSISSYAITPMNWALTYSILQPSSSTSNLAPTATIYRKTAALYLCRMEKNAVGFHDGKKMLNIRNYSSILSLNTKAINVLQSIIYSNYSGEEAENMFESIKAKTQTSSAHCSAISFVNFYDATGRIDFNRNAAGGSYSTMHSISTTNVGAVGTTLNLCQLLQYITAKFRTDYSSPKENALLSLEGEVDSHGPTILNYFWHNENNATVGHAIIVTKIYKNGTNYVIKSIDPNNESDIVTKTVPFDSTGFKIDNHKITSMGFYSSTNIRNTAFIDIDGINNDVSLLPTSTTLQVERENLQHSFPIDELLETSVADDTAVKFDKQMLVTAPAQDFKLTSETGKILYYSNDKLSGDIPVISSHLIENGEDVALLELVLGINEGLTCESNTSINCFTITSSTMNFCITSKGAKSISIGNGQILISGDDVMYTALLPGDSLSGRYYEISGECENETVIIPLSSTINVSSSYGKNEVTLFDAYMQPITHISFESIGEYNIVKSEDVAEPLCVVSADGSPLQYCIEEEIIP